jgi:hypothetical protein
MRNANDFFFFSLFYYLRSVFLSYDIRAQERNGKREKKFLLAYRWLLSMVTAPHLHAYAIRERKCSTFLPSVYLLSRATKRAYSYKILTNVCECKKKNRSSTCWRHGPTTHKHFLNGICTSKWITVWRNSSWRQWCCDCCILNQSQTYFHYDTCFNKFRPDVSPHCYSFTVTVDTIKKQYSQFYRCCRCKRVVLRFFRRGSRDNYYFKVQWLTF